MPVKPGNLARVATKCGYQIALIVGKSGQTGLYRLLLPSGDIMRAHPTLMKVISGKQKTK